MKFDHAVKYMGVIYPTGAEVPVEEDETKAETPEESEAETPEESDEQGQAEKSEDSEESEAETPEESKPAKRPYNRKS